VKYNDEEALMGACFSTTDWHLKDGQQEVFVDRWTTFLKWTRETQEGFERARLVADEANPHHFLSVGEWRDSTARQAWADEPRFLELFMPCLEVCDEVQGSQYDVKVTF
jgi:heme-degrading monooxygenase HmoA